MKAEILLNRRKVRNVEHKGDGGEVRCGNTRWQSLKTKGKDVKWRAASLNEKRTEGVRKETRAILYTAQILPKHELGPDRGTVGKRQRGMGATWNDVLLSV